MRYDLSDCEWSVIEPMLPKGRHGQQPQNNGRVMNGLERRGGNCLNGMAPTRPPTIALIAGAN